MDEASPLAQFALTTHASGPCKQTLLSVVPLKEGQRSGLTEQRAGEDSVSCPKDTSAGWATKHASSIYAPGSTMCPPAHLCYGVVRGVGGLHALVAADPHSDVSRLDHPHVIGTVTDRQRDGLHVFLHHVHDLGLLQRRHSEERAKRNCSVKFIELSGFRGEEGKMAITVKRKERIKSRKLRMRRSWKRETDKGPAQLCLLLFTWYEETMIHCSAQKTEKLTFDVFMYVCVLACIRVCVCVCVCVCVGELPVVLHPLDPYHWSSVYNRFCLSANNGGPRESRLQMLPLRAAESWWRGACWSTMGIFFLYT